MRNFPCPKAWWILAPLLLLGQPARAADDDALALEAEASPVAPAGADAKQRIYLEAAIGRSAQRYEDGSLDTSRLSLDINHGLRLGSGWRLGVSNRLDLVHPAGNSGHTATNSLREAYASWQAEGGSTLVDIGRINWRNGPAYGFNPTDFFRSGSLRAVTTADPVALRENRLGTVMVRAQHLFADSALTLAWAPKLADAPSNAPWSLDLGATNHSQRGLLSASTRLSKAVSVQALGFVEQGSAPQWGASATALLSDTLVAHAEAARGPVTPLVKQSFTTLAPTGTVNRASAGLTYTTPWLMSITAEYQYNGSAPTALSFGQLGQVATPALVNYLVAAQASQENAGRRAWLVYVTQKDLVRKGLDLAALLRTNQDDDSWFAWLELRQHWAKFDVALQWQTAHGRALTEFGIVPFRHAVQVLGTYYF